MRWGRIEARSNIPGEDLTRHSHSQTDQIIDNVTSKPFRLEWSLHVPVVAYRSVRLQKLGSKAWCCTKPDRSLSKMPHTRQATHRTSSQIIPPHGKANALFPQGHRNSSSEQSNIQHGSESSGGTLRFASNSDANIGITARMRGRRRSCTLGCVGLQRSARSWCLSAFDQRRKARRARHNQRRSRRPLTARTLYLTSPQGREILSPSTSFTDSSSLQVFTPIDHPSKSHSKNIEHGLRRLQASL